MKTRSTKPKSNRNTKYNRKTHRKPKKSLHKKRSRGRKYGGDLSTIGKLKGVFRMASCGDETDNYEKIVCEIGKINRNIETLKKDEQFMKFEKKGNENVVSVEIDDPSRKKYEETLTKITQLNKYFSNRSLIDERITADMIDHLGELLKQFNDLTDIARMKEYTNIPMYKFINDIMPIMNDIYSELDNKNKSNYRFNHPFGRSVQ